MLDMYRLDGDILPLALNDRQLIWHEWREQEIENV